MRTIGFIKGTRIKEKSCNKCDFKALATAMTWYIGRKKNIIEIGFGFVIIRMFQYRYKEMETEQAV